MKEIDPIDHKLAQVISERDRLKAIATRRLLKLSDQAAEIGRLQAEVERLRDKALRFDLDVAGIARRDTEAQELVELRAEVERLRAERDAYKNLSKSLQAQVDELDGALGGLR